MFWNRFYNLCIQNNTKPLNVATNLHFSSGSITQWKKGSIPGGETLLKIANYFKVSTDYLLGNDTPDNEYLHRYLDNNVSDIVDCLINKKINDEDLTIIRAVLNKYK